MSDYHMLPYSKTVIFLYMLLEGLTSRRLCQKSLADISVCHEKIILKGFLSQVFALLII